MEVDKRRYATLRTQEGTFWVRGGVATIMAGTNDAVSCLMEVEASTGEGGSGAMM